MTDDEKREHAEMVHELAEAIKYSLGMGEYGPPMEGEEGWIACLPAPVDDEDDGWDALYGDMERTAKERAENAQAVIEAIREAKERRMAQDRAKAAEPKPQPSSDDPWSVIGKAEDDGEWLMKKIRDFG